MAEIIYKEESYRIQGAIFEVYKVLGCGYQEPVYQESLEVECGMQSIPFIAHTDLTIRYKEKTLRQTFKPDFICYGSIIVEIKAVSALTPQHESQVINYLKVTGSRLGILVNFGSYPQATIKRFVL